MVEKSTLSLIVLTSIVLALSFKDLLLIKTNSVQTESKQSQNNNNNKIILEDDLDEKNIETEELNEKKIPNLKIKNNVQTLKILYCYSCGYKNAYEQYSQLIKSRFPELNIVGDNYHPAGYKLAIAQFLSTFKLILIGIILFGQNPFVYLNIPTPNIFLWAQQNKLYACLMIFFISNAIETNLISSGAFEIYLNDMQIWSKLESDRMPHEKELMQILDMNFNFESDKASAFGTGKFN